MGGRGDEEGERKALHGRADLTSRGEAGDDGEDPANGRRPECPEEDSGGPRGVGCRGSPGPRYLSGAAKSNFERGVLSLSSLETCSRSMSARLSASRGAAQGT